MKFNLIIVLIIIFVSCKSEDEGNNGIKNESIAESLEVDLQDNIFPDFNEIHETITAFKKLDARIEIGIKEEEYIKFLGEIKFLINNLIELRVDTSICNNFNHALVIHKDIIPILNYRKRLVSKFGSDDITIMALAINGSLNKELNRNYWAVDSLIYKDKDGLDTIIMGELVTLLRARILELINETKMLINK